MLSEHNMFSPQIDSFKQIDKVFQLAQQGNNEILKAYLDVYKIDLSQKNYEDVMVFEYLTGIQDDYIGVSLRKDKHLDCIMTLLNYGAKPIPHAAIYKHYAFLQHGDHNWVAALFLMAGFNKLPKGTEDYEHNIDKLAIVSTSREEEINSINQIICEYAKYKKQETNTQAATSPCTSSISVPSSWPFHT